MRRRMSAQGDTEKAAARALAAVRATADELRAERDGLAERVFFFLQSLGACRRQNAEDSRRFEGT